MASNDNGSTISEKSKFSWTVLLIIVAVALSITGFAYNVQSGLAIHRADQNIHHTSAELNAEYAQNSVVDQKFNEVLRRLDRIEVKLDRLNR